MNAVSSPKSRRAQLIAHQLALFGHLSLILRHLLERIGLDDLSPIERRALQRELAGLKKAAQSTRHRLKDSRRQS